MTWRSDLFDAAPPRDGVEWLAEGAVVLRRFALGEAAALTAAVEEVAAAAAFRHMVTPGGWRMSVAMTSCGRAGWVTDRGGYRYAADDPSSGRPWPGMPSVFTRLAGRAAAAAGFGGFAPDACLINRYEPGARLSPHRDEDERDLGAPVVSVSLGLPATFLWGGLSRKDRPRRIRLDSGDVMVWGGASRLVYHGVAPLAEAEHPLTGRSRINLTFRKAL
ncbi:MAG: DNA oxidative demethylase AlkB [Stellaceae bacterium]